MPEKVVSRRDMEENDAKQIAEAIGETLLNKVFIEKGKGKYEDRYFIYLPGEKSPIGSILKDGDDYITLLSYDVLKYAEDSKRALEENLMLGSLNSAVRAILESHLKEKGFEITRLEGGAYYLVFHIKKTESSG